MSDRLRSLRAELERRLLGEARELPTGIVRRWTKSAAAGLRGARLALRHREETEQPLDLDALARMVGGVGDLKGITMKVGQMLSYVDMPVPPEVKAALATLQSISPPMPFDRVQATIRAELFAADELLARMEVTPVAAASIGQVHRAVLPDGTKVAVKVQYPEIDRAIAADFGPASAGAELVRVLAPGANVRAVVQEARLAFLEECEYQREADHQERFARIFAQHPTLRVPAVHRRWSARRVLTTTWVDGARLDDFLAADPTQDARDRAGVALFELYLGAMYRHHVHNWDPHPGNYLFGQDQSLTVLDYGAVRELGEEQVRRLAGLTRAMYAGSDDAIQRALVELGMRCAPGSYDSAVARRLLSYFYDPVLRDEATRIEQHAAQPISSLVRDKRELLKLNLPADLLFVFRTRIGLLSVLGKLGARANWSQLERSFISGIPG